MLRARTTPPPRWKRGVLGGPRSCGRAESPLCRAMAVIRRACAVNRRPTSCRMGSEGHRSGRVWAAHAYGGREGARRGAAFSRQNVIIEPWMLRLNQVVLKPAHNNPTKMPLMFKVALSLATVAFAAPAPAPGFPPSLKPPRLTASRARSARRSELRPGTRRGHPGACRGHPGLSGARRGHPGVNSMAFRCERRSKLKLKTT